MDPDHVLNFQFLLGSVLYSLPDTGQLHVS